MPIPIHDYDGAERFLWVRPFRFIRHFRMCAAISSMPRNFYPFFGLCCIQIAFVLLYSRILLFFFPKLLSIPHTHTHTSEKHMPTGTKAQHQKWRRRSNAAANTNIFGRINLSIEDYSIDRFYSDIRNVVDDKWKEFAVISFENETKKIWSNNHHMAVTQELILNGTKDRTEEWGINWKFILNCSINIVRVCVGIYGSWHVAYERCKDLRLTAVFALRVTTRGVSSTH